MKIRHVALNPLDYWLRLIMSQFNHLFGRSNLNKLAIRDGAKHAEEFWKNHFLLMIVNFRINVWSLNLILFTSES